MIIVVLSPGRMESLDSLRFSTLAQHSLLACYTDHELAPSF